ncbi:MAG: hypothetical protein KKH94_13195 [Candidatus Omnitrophica bacterium]|nr:hypothetical protein [Candidatus Omnitrophota bacterium]
MTRNGQERRIERRKGPDVLMKSLSWIGGVGWLLMLGAMIILHVAKPKTKGFFDRYYHITKGFRPNWDTELTRYIFYIMIVGLCLSVIGLIINKTRHRRSDDTYRINLMVIGVISLMGIIIYLV